VSPLDPRPLSELLQKIAAAGPAVVAVDIDTSAPQFSALPQLKPSSPFSEPPFIWAAGAAEYLDDGSIPAECGDGSRPPAGVKCPDGSMPVKRSECRDGAMLPFGIAGGKVSVPPENWGIAISEEDHDGVIRHVPTSYQTCSGIIPSFAMAIATQYAKAKGLQPPEAGDHEDKPYFKRYAFEKPFSSRYFSRDHLGPDTLKGKIVIVGGTYCEANDLHHTPLGIEPGMRIVASQVESLIDGSMYSANEYLMLLVDILVGGILVFIHHYFSLGKALLLSLIAIPFLALTASLVLFASMAFWANTMPVSISVLIHQFYEHALEYRRLYLERQARSLQTR
jgi:CHASE2 domain-containing sensor protein